MIFPSMNILLSALNDVVWVQLISSRCSLGFENSSGVNI